MLLSWGQPWINHAYTNLQLILFAIGCLGWVIAYYFVALMIRRRHFVEIPWGAVAANIAWEFVWGFIYGSDMGFLFTLGYALWCIQDLFIVYSLFKYGDKQLINRANKNLFKPAAAFAIVAWTFMIYFFVADQLDTGYGANSGYILNVMMSALYIELILRQDIADFSEVVAWSKGLGTALLSVFNFMVKPHMPFLLTLCVVTLLLDATYVVVFYKKRQAARLASAGVPAGVPAGMPAAVVAGAPA
jgi:hypothetical protein